MKIGFDAKKAARNFTGIGNYSRRCIKGLSDYYSENPLILFAPQGGKAWGNLINLDNIEIVQPFRGLFYELWRILILSFSIKKKGVNIFHGLSNELPLGIKRSGCKSVVTIHDLIFLRYPETYSWPMRMILRYKTKYACKHADHIIAVSHKTKQDIIELYRIVDDKITVIHQSINPVFFKEMQRLELEKIKRKYMLPNCYILCVGTIEIRKNQLTLVKALTQLEESFHVVLVGKRTPYQDKINLAIKELGLQDRVHIYNNVPNDDLPAFYKMARIFCLMSVYEGFGIPVAEALASGVPVIAASGSCLEEAGGNHSIYVEAHDSNSIALSVLNIVKNPQTELLMKEKGKEYARKFEDKQQACQIMEVYNSLI